MFGLAKKRQTGRQSHYSEGSDNVCVCVVFCLSLTHMLMSEAPRQKESCDGVNCWLCGSFCPIAAPPLPAPFCNTPA